MVQHEIVLFCYLFRTDSIWRSPFWHAALWFSCRRSRVPHRSAAQPKGTAVVDLTRSMTKLVLQSCTLGCLSRVSIMKRE